MLAGAFIGLGALYFTLVVSDASLGFAAARVTGGVVFSLGLLLVVVAGAELFTGNNLLAMAWADGCVSLARGAAQLGRRVRGQFRRRGRTGAAGLSLGPLGNERRRGGRDLPQDRRGQGRAARRGARSSSAMLCNILVCMAVWMALAGRSVVDKFVAILFPISAFVAAGFEHSIANMYFFPLAMLLKWHGLALPPGGDAITFAGMLGNLGPVIAGNIVGGSVLVALVYWVIYLRGRPPAASAGSE